MSKNIVVFGPAESGKSSLIGYMFKNLIEKFDFDKFDKSMKLDLGSSYDYKQKYAYIVDESIHERYRDKGLQGIGTTRYMHTRRIKIGDNEVHIIDTPGAEHRKKERFKGLTFGEIGIFMVELSDLTNCSLKNYERLGILLNFFAPLFLWFKLKENSKVIILTSKMDRSDFSENSFNEGIRTIKEICGDEITKILNIIPVAIDFTLDMDHNVFSQSEFMDWYKGPTLMEVLQNNLDSAPSNNKKLYFMTDWVFNKTGIGSVWRGKVIQGELKKGNEVRLTPVEYNKEYINVTGRIRNIRYERGADTDLATEGSIVGIDLHDLKINGRRCDKDDFETLETTCITDTNDKYVLMGNILQFSIYKKDIEKFNILENISLLWFGRLIPSHVIHTSIEEGHDYGILTIEMETVRGSLPEQNGKPAFDKFLLVRQETNYVPGQLLEFGVPESIILDIKKLGYEIETFNKRFNDYTFEIDKNKLKFICEDGFRSLIRRIKNNGMLSDFEVIIKQLKIED